MPVEPIASFVTGYQVFPEFLPDCLTLEVGTDRLCRNVGNWLPIYAA